MKQCNKIIFVFAFLISSILFAQKNMPRLSPKCFVGQTIGYTNVEINYGSPGVKDRKIWGGLVPYNEVWRTGANEATTIQFDNDAIIKGKLIPAGSYSLFTIPTEKDWTVILNKVYDQWGAFKYDKNEDFFRFKVTPQPNNFVERLRFTFKYKEPYIAEVVMEWEKLKFAFDINAQVKEIEK
jgi:hypothetical protein